MPQLYLEQAPRRIFPGWYCSVARSVAMISELEKPGILKEVEIMQPAAEKEAVI